MEINPGLAFEALVNWLTTHLSPLFDAVTSMVGGLVAGLETALLFPPAYVMIPALTALAWWLYSRGIGLVTLVGLLFIHGVSFTAFGTEVSIGMAPNFWVLLMQTLALILVATLLCLLIGVPMGIWASKSKVVDSILRPVLDFMQTMPAFVYLIPAVLLFGLGEVPGVIATFIFATPPVVRLTNLGIRQVDPEVVEAARSFGATTPQMLMKVELPIALPTIMAGVNQTIMLSLSMVVIAALIGANGLGQPVMTGITQLDIATGFNGGLAIVILAIFLDRVTQAIGEQTTVQEGRQGTA